MLSLVKKYAETRGVAKHGEYMHRLAVRSFGKFLGREPELADLDEETVCRWLTWLEDSSGLAARSVKNKRSELITLWRFAAEHELVDQPPAAHKIRPVKVPRPIPVAWDRQQLKQLVDACARLDGVTASGIPRSRYFMVLIRVAYESGLRRGDIFKINLNDIDPARGTIRVVMAKTGLGHTSTLSQATVDLVLDMAEALRVLGDPNHRTPLRWPQDLDTFYYWFKKLTVTAGVPYGALQQLRRTSATLTEAATPGSAQRLLGHTTPGLANLYYIDRSKLPSVRPPEVF